MTNLKSMKKILGGAILAMAFPCMSFADIATFDAGQGWVDGNVLDATPGPPPGPGAQTGQTSGINWVSNQANAYTVDSTNGKLNVASASFFRQVFDLGPGGATGLDIPTGGSITYNAVVDQSALNAFTGNRILLEIALAAPTDPFNATTGNAANGIQLRSDGTDWIVDAPAFGNNGGTSSGIALASGDLDLSLVYNESAAGIVDVEVFLNGISSYTSNLGAGPSGGGLYGWTNSSQGTGTGGTLMFNSLELIVVDPAAVVPEPSSLGLLGFGLAGCLIRRRRKS